MDYRKFSVGYLQHNINFAWHIRGTITIVGRDSYFYILHFEHMDDLNHVCNKGPWSMNGALFVLEKWGLNLVLGRMQLNFVSLWVQLNGLPFEYHYPELMERMGQLMGIFERVDLEDRLPHNIKFMRIRVRVDPWSPLMVGFMLRLDDGSRVWI